ncbi:MAG TPA: nucleotide exchange factor GrpE [Thermomicrobiales bacterium]|nr:nucleotide exchange factor GrpE [Thermomicrobiales bacterium]
MTESADQQTEMTQSQPQPPPNQEVNADELLELLRRERADFLNYKRRVARERDEERQRVRGDLLTELLPLLDDLDRAVTHVPEELADQPWPRGVLMVDRRLHDLLTRMGVEQIGAHGEAFDPSQHEALYYEETVDGAEPRITTVIRPGYRMGDRLLRPAQVGVGTVDEET